jgi:RP/EB family microtubule-associated protein
MQDNLDFLQFAKRHWDQYYPGGDYDALARRKASGPASTAPASSSRTSAGGGGARRGGGTPTGTSTATRGPRVAGGIGGGGSGRDSALSRENETLKEAVAGLERERDFYFSKLRDIELLLQNAVEADPEIEKDEDGLIKHIQAILYSTEVSL